MWFGSSGVYRLVFQERRIGVECFTRRRVGVLFVCRLVDPLPNLICEVIVSLIEGFVVGRASWSMYWSPYVYISLDMVVVAFGSFRWSWEVRSVRAAPSGDSASSRLLFGRC